MDRVSASRDRGRDRLQRSAVQPEVPWRAGAAAGSRETLSDRQKGRRGGLDGDGAQDLRRAERLRPIASALPTSGSIRPLYICTIMNPGASDIAGHVETLHRDGITALKGAFSRQWVEQCRE